MCCEWSIKAKELRELLSLSIREENRNMKTNKTAKMKYDRDADVLMFETDKSAKIDYARELGDVIVHFTKDNLPVLVEILNASHMLSNQKDLKKQIKALA